MNNYLHQGTFFLQTLDHIVNQEMS